MNSLKQRNFAQANLAPARQINADDNTRGGHPTSPSSAPPPHNGTRRYDGYKDCVQVLDLGPVPQKFPRSLTSSPGGKGVTGGSILQLPQQAHADVYLRGPSSLILLSSLMVLAAFIIQFLSPLPSAVSIAGNYSQLVLPLAFTRQQFSSSKSRRALPSTTPLLKSATVLTGAELRKHACRF